MNHLGAAWGRQVNAWRVPTEIRGYPLPVGGQFAHSQDSLDPDLFDPSEKMWPWIRGSLMDILEAFWRPRYGEWQHWTRIYLAGSLASYWHSTLDFDTLVGVNTGAFVSEHPEFGGMSDAEVCQALTHEFITELDPLITAWSFPPEPDLHRLMDTLGGPDPTPVYQSVPMTTVTGLGPMEMTFYVNPAAYDIRVIRPYAAYDVTNDRWAVHPDRMAKSWGAGALSHAFWERMADLADQIKAALNLSEPARTSECLRIYDQIHSDRGQAFAPAGRGVTDPRSLQWIVLNRWGLLGPLEVAAHPGREMAHIPPSIASQRHADTSWRAMDPGFEEGGHGAWHEHPAVIIPEGGAAGRKRYTLHLNGQPTASRSTLAEAKAALEAEHGPQTWKRVRPKKQRAEHYYFGPTTEFSDPAEYHYVERLERNDER
jgi:hypothetical protein